MLGRFLELSLLAADTGVAWQRWLGLGFGSGEAGDAWPHSYGVVACEGLAIGLHGGGDEPALTFVHADVAQLEQELSTRLIGIERARLDPEHFNLLELREPGGMLLRVLEARTFSPPAELPTHTSLGRFRAVSLPCADLAEARGFWERLDLEVTELNDPWEGLAIAGLPLICHAQADLHEAALLFDADGTPLRAPPAAALKPVRPVPALHTRGHRLLRAPEGIALLQLETPR